jgi:hypothetical protein
VLYLCCVKAYHNHLQDLTFCYQHMSENDFQTLDTLDSVIREYIDGQLSDEGTVFKTTRLCPRGAHITHTELEIPFHMVPPDPDDADSECSEQ